MSDRTEQLRASKRRQQAALRRAMQIMRAEHAELWAEVYERAKREIVD